MTSRSRCPLLALVAVFLLLAVGVPDILSTAPPDFTTAADGSIAGATFPRELGVPHTVAAQIGANNAAETQLFVDSLTPSVTGALIDTGYGIRARYGGTFTQPGPGHGTDRRIRAYLQPLGGGAAAFFDSGALVPGAACSWSLEILVLRADATHAVIVSTFLVNGLAVQVQTQSALVVQWDVPNIVNLQITGQVTGGGNAANDLVAVLGEIEAFAPTK